MRWLAFLLLISAPAAAAEVLYAGGAWAAIDRGASCEAGTRSIRVASKGKIQARAGFAFDLAGPRRGQFFAQLSRLPRDGSAAVLTIGDRPFLLVTKGGWAWSRGAAQDAAIIAAARVAGAMRVESRDSAGRRFIDRFLLDGAPTAIDAAAARCAGKMRRA